MQHHLDGVPVLLSSGIILIWKDLGSKSKFLFIPWHGRCNRTEACFEKSFVRPGNLPPAIVRARRTRGFTSDLVASGLAQDDEPDVND